jgi:hypothetical protein
MHGQAPDPNSLIAGADPARPLDAVFVNAPLRDYSVRPRVNDFTLPVLGMAYIATYAADSGYNVGVLDAEACGLSISDTARLVNEAAPRWAGFNLLAPTYEVSAAIAAGLDPDIKIMLGGHQAKAMPVHILADPRMGRRRGQRVGQFIDTPSHLLVRVLRTMSRRTGKPPFDYLPTKPWAVSSDVSNQHLEGINSTKCSTRTKIKSGIEEEVRSWLRLVCPVRDVLLSRLPVMLSCLDRL